MKKLIVEAIGTGLLAFTAMLSNGDAFAIAGVLAISMIAFGNISGGHFNIAITMAMWSRKVISFMEAVKYSLAQVVGAVLAIALVNMLSNNEILQIRDVMGGTIGKNTWIVELIASAVLLIAFFGCIRNKMTPALGVALAHIVLIPLGFMVNTSVTIAQFFNGGSLYVLAIIAISQIAGGILAEKLEAKLNKK